MKQYGKMLYATAIVCVMLLSGMMVLPSNIVAEQGQPDLVVRNIGWVFPVKQGEELPVTVYIENIGSAPVQKGFWIEINYAEQSGFWQEATETHTIWIDPPIKIGEVKAVDFTSFGLNTHQANFEVSLDTTNAIMELNEMNNYKHVCSIAIGATPGSSISTPVYLRNERIDITETFIIEVDPSTVPDGWGFTGGLPPTTVTALPGGNVVLSETAIVPTDTILNSVFRLNATRQSDGAVQSIAIRVVTTREIGFSFNPYQNEFSVWGVDQIDSEFTLTTELISKRGAVSYTMYTVTDNLGQYTSATVKSTNTKNLNMFEIIEINYNGLVTITPDANMFLTTFLVDNNELRHFNQYMNYGPIQSAHTQYNINLDQTTIRDDESTTTLNGFNALGVRISNGKVLPIRLDTRDPSVPLCPNRWCSFIDCYMMS
jgi:hypothetical protein